MKLLYDGTQDLEFYENMRFKQFYLQPILPGFPDESVDPRLAKDLAIWWYRCRFNFEKTLKAIKQNPKWRMSFQAHKLAGVR